MVKRDEIDKLLVRGVDVVYAQENQKTPAEMMTRVVEGKEMDENSNPIDERPRRER